MPRFSTKHGIFASRPTATVMFGMGCANRGGSCSTIAVGRNEYKNAINFLVSRTNQRLWCAHINACTYSIVCNAETDVLNLLPLFTIATLHLIAFSQADDIRNSIHEYTVRGKIKPRVALPISCLHLSMDMAMNSTIVKSHAERL